MYAQIITNETRSRFVGILYHPLKVTLPTYVAVVIVIVFHGKKKKKPLTTRLTAQE